MNRTKSFRDLTQILIAAICGLAVVIGCNNAPKFSPVADASASGPTSNIQPATAPISSATPAPCSSGTFGSQCTGGSQTGAVTPPGAHAFLYQLTPMLDPKNGYAASVGTYAGVKVTGSMNLLSAQTLQSDIDLYATQIGITTQVWSDGFPGLPNLQEWFGLCYDGTWMAPTSGTYTIVTDVDDAIAIWIDGKLIGENDDGNVHATIQASNNSEPYNLNPVAFPSLTLTAGPHNVEIMYYQGWPYSLRSLVWVLPPGTPFVSGATFPDSELMQLTNPINGVMNCPH